MHVVGSDRIIVVEGRVQPAGTRHAVDLDGRAVCRPRGLAYIFPAIGWDGDDTSAACGSCAETLDEQLAVSTFEAYPARPAVAVNLLAGLA